MLIIQDEEVQEIQFIYFIMVTKEKKHVGTVTPHGEHEPGKLEKEPQDRGTRDLLGKTGRDINDRTGERLTWKDLNTVTQLDKTRNS